VRPGLDDLILSLARTVDVTDLMVNIAVVGGMLVVLVVLWEAFETIVLPRRVSRRFRLTRLFYRSTWIPWRAVGRKFPPGRRREGFLSVFGPMSLLMLLILWTSLLVVGFALLQLGTGSGVLAFTGRRGWLADMYASAATLFTLTPGDVSETTAPARVLTIIDAGTGLAMLAMVIGYLPILSQAFSRREANVSLLDARAGSPPSAGELLFRHAGIRDQAALPRLLEQWEQWCADLLETHVSFPVLAFYRSQHANQSWVAAMTTVLDTCAMILAGLEDGSQRGARLTFAMARHAAVDLSLTFSLAPQPVDHDRLPASELAEVRRMLRDAGLALREGPDVDAKLRDLRAMYEPYMNALGTFLLMELPMWRGRKGARDNWLGLI
jgi:hypothetical protein